MALSIFTTTMGFFGVCLYSLSLGEKRIFGAVFYGVCVRGYSFRYHSGSCTRFTLFCIATAMNATIPLTKASVFAGVYSSSMLIFGGPVPLNLYVLACTYCKIKPPQIGSRAPFHSGNFVLQPA